MPKLRQKCILVMMISTVLFAEKSLGLESDGSTTVHDASLFFVINMDMLRIRTIPVAKYQVIVSVTCV